MLKQQKAKLKQIDKENEQKKSRGWRPLKQAEHSISAKLIEPNKLIKASVNTIKKQAIITKILEKSHCGYRSDWNIEWISLLESD